jgi:pSer/pThr/pTyr-binding forkhead associated (FHA) protein
VECDDKDTRGGVIHAHRVWDYKVVASLLPVRSPNTIAFATRRAKHTVATLHDSECSTKHCTITLKAGRVLSLEVKDEDSTNGTFVNGKKVAKKMCFVGDAVRIGSNVIRVTSA